MRSLFILSLPRSLSSQIYHVASAALGLAEPRWAMDGEILNVDRYVHHRGVRWDEGSKFTPAANHRMLFPALLDFLDQVVLREGFAYKDVTQPFVLAAWPGLRELRVLKLRRDLADVAYATLNMGWFYPSAAATRPARVPSVGQAHVARRALGRWYPGVVRAINRGRLDDAVIEGLWRASCALESVPGLTLDYQDLIADEECLRQALAQLYPESKIPPLHYIDARFAAQRAAIIQRRARTDYQRLQARVEKVCRELNASGK